MEQKQKFPTEMVELPSKGLIYPTENPLSSGQIEMRYMTAREEDILTNQNYIKQGTALDRLLKSLIVSDIDLDDMILGDKNAVLVAARILGYGKDYTFRYGTEEVSVDLTECPLQYIDETGLTKGVNEFKYTTPTTKTEITYKILTNKDEKLIQAELEGLKKLNKEASPELSTRLKYAIQAVNGDREKSSVRDFVDNYFLAKDSRAFRDHLVSTQPSIRMEASVVTENGIVEGVNVPVNINFFWPDAGI
ncbi:hypothetical protein UFOVP54_27 [uncultured Caudovirales phage]|uniref:Uncharacterized protein n=1 Tax=uncultured Caudovirales phage TaxID=2100421 RepID=A0A6J5KQU3_9CAUD|nr:hypothetical protein UFOVP54_27 [uncultured Caudovirales phage]